MSASSRPDPHGGGIRSVVRLLGKHAWLPAASPHFAFGILFFRLCGIVAALRMTTLAIQYHVWYLLLSAAALIFLSLLPPGRRRTLALVTILVSGFLISRGYALVHDNGFMTGMFYILVIHTAIRLTSWPLVLGVTATLFLLYLAGSGRLHLASELTAGDLIGFSIQAIVFKCLLDGLRRIDETSRQLEQQTHRAQEMAARLQRTLDLSPDLLATLGPRGEFQAVNPASAEILGYTPEELVGRPLIDLVCPSDREAALKVLDSLRSETTPVSFQSRCVRQGGATAWIEWRIVAITGEEAFQCAARDITERKRIEEQLEHLAFHDAVTGLPNRTLFMDRLKQGLARAARRKSRLALLFLDLDNFKAVNDTLGHDAGDRMLVEVARRLARCLRKEDTAARFGGDEFSILLDKVEGEADATEVAERIFRDLRTPFAVGGKEMFISASIGIAVSPPGGEEPDTLLSKADLAMYHSKANAQAPFAVWHTAMTSRVRESLELRAELVRALERQELRTYYQPLVELRTGRIAAFEALVRWAHPERGIVAPGGFLSIAEEMGLIVAIDRWVMHEACRQVRAWQSRFPGASLLATNVNISGASLLQEDVVEYVRDTLAGTGLAPGNLQLEIVEGTVLKDDDHIRTTLTRLADLGVGLALDDFGTGYSSCMYLKRFPISVLKIDRSFAAGLGQQAADTDMLRAIASFARTLGLTTVVEGIETETQAEAARRLRFDLGQGFLFTPPVPAETAAAFLAGPAWSIPTRATGEAQAAAASATSPPLRGPVF